MRNWLVADSRSRQQISDGKTTGEIQTAKELPASIRTAPKAMGKDWKKLLIEKTPTPSC